MTHPPPIAQPTLTGQMAILEPLRANHEASLLDAARDGQLWDMKVSVIPGPETVARYMPRRSRAGTLEPSCLS
jgi:N-acetyltransferase